MYLNMFIDGGRMVVQYSKPMQFLPDNISPERQVFEFAKRLYPLQNYTEYLQVIQQLVYLERQA